MKILTFLCFILLFSTLTIVGQSLCSPPEIVLNKNAPNIFDEKQEMYLGEVLAEYLERDFRLVSDLQANKYLNDIGQRIVAKLPPTNIKFSFHIIDIPEVNAFAIAGGRIYVTRKLVAFVKNEDELAGILGHELGHGIVRHSSIDMSKLFTEVLNVRSVGDKKDIYEKYNQLLDRQNTKRVNLNNNHEDKQQLEADQIGLFAMTAAGYNPNASISAWERLTENKKTGNSLTDFFGTTKPDQKRLRELVKATTTISPSCFEKLLSFDENFRRWQSYIVTTTFKVTERLIGLELKKQLAKLPNEIKHIQFSPDGNYILSQDDSGINVLTREPFKVSFRIPARNAKFANFTSDFKHITLQTFGLRVEKWNVETKNAVAINEVYIRSDCWQTAISLDAKYLVCYSGIGNLDILNVATNENIYRKEKFYIPDFFEQFSWRFTNQKVKENNLIQMEFSPDGKYLLASRVSRSFGGFFSSGGYLSSTYAENSSFIAYDLAAKVEVPLADSLKKIVSSPFSFYGNDKIVGQHRTDRDKSGIFTFPQGERVEKFYMNADSYTKPHQGDYLIVRPTNKNPVGVYDLKQKKFIGSNKYSAFDGFGDYFASENQTGNLQLFKLGEENGGAKEIGSVDLPKGDFGDIRSIQISSDLGWISLSEKTRGGVWDLKTGNMNIFIRGFRGAYFDEENKVYIDAPRFKKEPRAIASLNPKDGTGTILREVETLNTKQYGKYLVHFKTKREEDLLKKKKEETAKNKDTEPISDSDESDIAQRIFFTFGSFPLGSQGSSNFEDSSLNVNDVKTGLLLWSKTFKTEPPTYQVNESDQNVLLYWRLTSKAAKEIIKNSPKLRQSVAALGEKEGDYLVQILDANTGNITSETLIETGKGSFRINRIFSTGDYLTISDSEDRILVYSISKGTILWKLFGNNIEIDKVNNVAVFENIPGQLSVFDLIGGRKLDELVFPSSIELVKFNLEGSKLCVLTSSQTYYIFNTKAFNK